MAKQAISITLEARNLLWLRGQVRASNRKSVSEVLDNLVTEARLGGRVQDGTIRSVVGTIQLPADDPDLTLAGAAIRSFFPLPRTRSARSEGRRSRHPTKQAKSG